MADRDNQGLSGRDLQASQSGGESGEFGGNMEQQQAKGMVGGGPTASDNEASGGSSGTGGYGRAQQAINQPGAVREGDRGQSRGEAYDEQQGGGRGPESISREGDETGGDDVPGDAGAEQDRAEAEFDEEQS